MPAFLSCGHTVCEGCYKNALNSENKSIKCVTHNKEIELTKEFVYNYLILESMTT
jgi:hypothetical protein